MPKAIVITIVVVLFVLASYKYSQSGSALSGPILDDTSGGTMKDKLNTCPGSPSFLHATCNVQFMVKDFMCKDVKEEVERRIQGKDNWVDPKSHPGKYALLESGKDYTLATRTTGDGSNFVDKFKMTYHDIQGEGCSIDSCSEAQSQSVYDYSTNYCNMYNLLCGSTNNCKVSRHDIKQLELSAVTLCPFRAEADCKR